MFTCALFQWPDYKDAVCHDAVTEATVYNNWRCAGSAFTLTLGAHLICSYIPAMIANLHLMVVWQNNFFEVWGWLVHIVVWAASIIMTIIPFYHGHIEPLGFICFVNFKSVMSTFIYPIAPFVFGSFILHLSTVTYLIVMSVPSGPSARSAKTYHWIKLQIKMQWRSMLLTNIMVIVFSLFLTYFISFDVSGYTNLDENSPFVRKWLECLAANGSPTRSAQNTCSPIALASLPDDSFTQITLTAIFIVGIWGPVIVATSAPFYIEVTQAVQELVDKGMEIVRGKRRDRKHMIRLEA
ncbi:hypothetical protein HK102_001729 [Quaeritorhiza haematococci]|nr:hypothetical protein HK102_001729 [Quaeritorhiza haematococci]